MGRIPMNLSFSNAVFLWGLVTLTLLQIWNDLLELSIEIVGSLRLVVSLCKMRWILKNTQFWLNKIWLIRPGNPWDGRPFWSWPLPFFVILSMICDFGRDPVLCLWPLPFWLLCGIVGDPLLPRLTFAGFFVGLLWSLPPALPTINFQTRRTLFWLLYASLPAGALISLVVFCQVLRFLLVVGD